MSARVKGNFCAQAKQVTGESERPLVEGRPTVSLIIPVYNSAETLPACLDSVAAQTWKDFEVILVDDGSQDHSRDILHQWQRERPCVTVLCQQQSGVSRARNAGVAVASGEYVAFCDSDDVLHPQFLETLVGNTCQCGADLCCCEFQAFTEQIEWPVREETERVELRGEERYRALQRPKWGGYVWNKLFRRTLIQKRPGINFPESIHVLEDEIFVLQYLARTDTLCCISQPLYGYRFRSDSALHARLSPKKLTAVLGREEAYRLVTQAVLCPDIRAGAWNALMREYAICYKKLWHTPVENAQWWRRKIEQGVLLHGREYPLDKSWSGKEKIYYFLLFLLSRWARKRGEDRE